MGGTPPASIFGCGSVFFGCGSVFFGCGSVVVCLISVAKSHYKSKETGQNRAFFVEATHQELKQTREQGDFERVRRTDQRLVTAE